MHTSPYCTSPLVFESFFKSGASNDFILVCCFTYTKHVKSKKSCMWALRFCLWHNCILFNKNKPTVFWKSINVWTMYFSTFCPTSTIEFSIGVCFLLVMFYFNCSVHHLSSIACVKCPINEDWMIDCNLQQVYLFIFQMNITTTL